MNKLININSKQRIGFVVLFFVFLFSIPHLVLAQDDLPNPMSPPRMVNDFTGTFSSSQVSNLEEKLRSFHDQTTVQIYVVTVNTFGGDAGYNYAARLGEKWGIGQKGKDNGVLILIKPKTEEERGNVFIAPGYGLEAILNDSYCGRIIDNEMIPYLKENDYYTATDKAVDAIIQRIQSSEESVSEDGQVVRTMPKDNSTSWGEIFLACVIFPLFIICMIIFPRFRSVVFYILLIFLRSGGGSGKGGGGSFGGGGGGRFGGGGAGRSW